MMNLARSPKRRINGGGRGIPVGIRRRVVVTRRLSLRISTFHGRVQLRFGNLAVSEPLGRQDRCIAAIAKQVPDPEDAGHREQPQLALEAAGHH